MKAILGEEGNPEVGETTQGQGELRNAGRTRGHHRGTVTKIRQRKTQYLSKEEDETQVDTIREEQLITDAGNMRT